MPDYLKMATESYAEVLHLRGEVEALRAEVEALRKEVGELSSLVADAWACATNEDIGSPFYEETAKKVRAAIDAARAEAKEDHV